MLTWAKGPLAHEANTDHLKYEWDTFSKLQIKNRLSKGSKDKNVYNLM